MSVLVFFCLMFRRPPRPTSTATFVPYTTLFLSRQGLGEAGRLREVARELAHRRAARTFAAVHVPRQADDQSADAVVAAEGGELRGVLAELAALQGHQRRSALERGVGDRHADGLAAGIETQQALAPLDQGGQFCDSQGTTPASPLGWQAYYPPYRQHTGSR